MQTPASPQANEPKPVSEFTRSELVRLPELTTRRLRFRRFIKWLVRLLVRLFTLPEVSGLKNLPLDGPVLVVGNHIGDADDILKIAFFPRFIDPIGKIELYDLFLLGKIMHAYGVIWIRRGQPDRQALKAAIKGLSEGRIITINPEGRESLTGALEEATNGAAFLALKSNAPVVPVAITGAYNQILYKNMCRLRRTRITFTIGQPIYLQPAADHKSAIEEGTRVIMQAIAAMLPPEYRGVYQSQEFKG